MFSGASVGANTNLTRTALDEAFNETFDLERQPGEVRHDDPLFFRQRSTDKSAVIDEPQQGVGDFTEHAERQNYDEVEVLPGTKETHAIRSYKKALPISEEFFADDQFGQVQEWVRSMGERARTSMTKFPFPYTYQDAFSGNTTNAGVALVSNSHTTISGDTVDNLETGALNADNLATVIRSLRLQKGEDGDLGSYHSDGLLVPINLFNTATVLADSVLKPGTGNNDVNFISKVYPGMVIGASAYLDSTFNTLNSDANTSYFVVSRNHSITRTVRQSMSNKFVPSEFSPDGTAFYRAMFREEAHTISYGGLVGSNGTA